MNYLVVGGTSGIGAAVVKRLVMSEHANVLFCGRRRDAGEKLMRSLNRGRHGNVEMVRADITEESDVAALFDRVRDAFGELHGAFNAAGIVGKDSVLRGAPFHKSSAENFDRVLDVNVRGMWRCLRGELAIMAPQGSGSIVTCSSVAGLRSADSMSASYTASKHAVVGMTRALAVEYAPHGIRLNAVCPGVIDTDMLGGMRDELLTDLRRKNPAARIGMPEEVADAVVFLLSDRSQSISGTALTVDAGGLTGAL
ncbi:SDR family oxidoreductase [Nocardiopsis gilva YIM 90087]|uniref:SDR family oxidoreductase n=1 Tax=Nocardiopsis gilva YIM 90087 TaxID=1235441 RepID=A0A223S8G7_9ACTN|nr:SDR family oxidoreductase [Nocardiopsis gilva]ASU84413.1 SDR family oxidoreductase [Nocardiopsis gilva YIM 90087]